MRGYVACGSSGFDLLHVGAAASISEIRVAVGDILFRVIRDVRLSVGEGYPCNLFSRLVAWGPETHKDRSTQTHAHLNEETNSGTQ